jgi:thymidylate synthase
MPELPKVTLEVERPRGGDAMIEELADSERLAWMHANFADPRRVVERGDVDSDATRLCDDAHGGRGRIAWVAMHLRDVHGCRGATIPTLQPRTDTSHGPCASLLDFYERAESLVPVANAHSTDFGTKGYANLVELATVFEEVAAELAVAPDTFTLIVKWAHVYGSDFDQMLAVLENVAGR